MKTIITAAAFAMAAFTTTAAQASPLSDCYTMGDSVNMLAVIRDQGLSEGVVYALLSKDGQNDKLVLLLIELVYASGKNLTPDALEAVYVAGCIKSLGAEA